MEQSGADGFAADRLKPAQVLARLAELGVAQHGATDQWHGRRGSSRATDRVFRPGVAGLLLGATRKRLAWLSAGGRR